MNKMNAKKEAEVEKITWSTVRRKVADLVPASYNPREMTYEQDRALETSLERFDLAEIPVVNADNGLIGGHQRIRKMIELGRGDEEIDVRVPSRQLTEEEAKELNVRLNKNRGQWDFDMLANLFDTGDLLEWGFDPDELGDVEEVDQRSPGGLQDAGKLAIQPFEHYDYVVFFFRDQRDWVQAIDRLGLEKVDASLTRKCSKIGLGRVLKGETLLALLNDNN